MLSFSVQNIRQQYLNEQYASVVMIHLIRVCLRCLPVLDWSRIIAVSEMLTVSETHKYSAPEKVSPSDKLGFHDRNLSYLVIRGEFYCQINTKYVYQSCEIQL